MLNSKIRRHSGRKYYGQNSNSDIENYTPLLVYWSDWYDYRDGMRNWFSDKTKIKHPKKFYYFESDLYPETIRYNNKNKLLLLRRKAKKLGRYACQ